MTASPDETAAKSIAAAGLEDSYRLLFEQNPHPMWVYDTENLQILAVNNAATVDYGYGKDEILAMFLPDLGVPEETARLRYSVGQRRENPQFAHTGVWKICKKDGTVLEVETTSNALPFNGRAARLVMGVDVTERRRTEQTLRESEARLRGIFDQVAVGIVQTDLEGRFVQVNQRFADLLQETPAALYQKTFQEITHPDDLEPDLEQVRQLVTGTIQTFSMEKRYIRRDETVVWVNLAVSLVRDRHGQPQFMIGVVEDIGNRKRIEAEHQRVEANLRHSEMRSRLLVEKMPVLVNALDANNHFTLWNQECERVTGYSAAEICHNPNAPELLYPDLKHRQQMLQEWEQHGSNFRDWRLQLTCKDGSTRTIAWSNISQHHPIPGLESWAIGIDITERERARQEILHLNAQLEQQNQMLEALMTQRTFELETFINALPDPIFVINREDGRLLFCNDPNAKLFGLSDRHQLQGRSTEHFYQTVVEGNDYARQNDQVFETGELLRELETIELAGGKIHLDTLKIPLKHPNGEVYALVGASRDITELVEARQSLAERTRQLELTNQELESFSYSVSHDLRAPLRHISGFVTALSNQLETLGMVEDAKVTHYLKIIQEGAQKMGLLVDGLLTLSRVGRRQLVKRPVNLQLVVEEAIALLQHPSTTQLAEIHRGSLPTVSGDATLLQQVFTNLIDNALKFSRHAQPARIEIGCQPDGVLYVRDNGVGFSMDYADQLFGAFQRLHSTQEFEGTGIGLAIVQRIIHRHGGTIWADSQPGQGAVFYFKLG